MKLCFNFDFFYNFLTCLSIVELGTINFLLYFKKKRVQRRYKCVRVFGNLNIIISSLHPRKTH